MVAQAPSDLLAEGDFSSTIDSTEDSMCRIWIHMSQHRKNLHRALHTMQSQGPLDEKTTHANS
jgi:hypothetical protein